ncbi:MAG: DUF1579 domain-containing protein [Ignavibacterium sp.]|nr:DUF1579 domain-containing protein [Ignavibacterium sp.]
MISNKIIITSIFMLLSVLSFAQIDQEISDNQLKKLFDISNPVDIHKEFSKFVGDWKIQAKYWFNPEETPIEAEGNAKIELILDNKYLKISYTLNVNEIKIEGITLETFDKFINKYKTVLIENLNYDMILLTGDSDDGGKTIFYKGSYFDSIRNEQLKVKSIVHYISDNQIQMELFSYFEDVETKIKEFIYTR